MMDCLFAKCVPCITDCVMAELEKLGSKFRVAQRYGETQWMLSGLTISPPLPLSCRIAKDPRFERLPCLHKGTYADDCLVNRVTQVSGCHWKLTYYCMSPSQHKCYIPPLSTSVILSQHVIVT